MSKLTPMMKQYMEIKKKYHDTIVFFRLGDFYEMFFDDAILASKILEITLTGRECGQKEKAPMCGVPYHSADSYIIKLVEKGYKVAICEQVEDPSKSTGIVKREVVKVITPGTITDYKALDEKSNNYLCSIFSDIIGIGISYVDVSTGDLYATEINKKNKYTQEIIIDELGKISPKEIILSDESYNNEAFLKKLKSVLNCTIDKYSFKNFNENKDNIYNELIKKQFTKINNDNFDLNEKFHAKMSIGMLLNYLNNTQKVGLINLNNLSFYSIDNYMTLDINTRRNLELVETIRGKTKKGSLIGVLDKTSTAMGGRLLKRWIEEPLIDIKKIEYRLNIIEELYNNIFIMDELKVLLNNVYDIERLMGKITYGSCNGRDLLALKNSISILPKLKKLLSSCSCEKLKELGKKIDDLNDIYTIINSSIIENPPVTIKEGGLIKSQYNNELAELRKATIEGKQWISNLEEKEKNRTGIKSLKIGYNKVFGYYIEVTKSNLKLVPEDYIRKQTLSNCERYITSELKEMESKILGAEEKMIALEYELFIEIRDKIKSQIARIQHTSKILAQIDALNSLAIVAYNNDYVRPNLNNNGIIRIKNGRHPVVEQMLNDEIFIPNDTILDNNENRVSIITGPNMAGKSTYMRQVAIICLMAQIGSFVPADEANISIVDKIFTRIGASDDLSQGQSTFMVEMKEVANILNNSTSKSLIILDEIGRGTSTFDGLSIAWAVIEYIANKNKIGAKTLFATHYHELTELEGKIDGIKNYKIEVKENNDDIIFLRKISRGGADKSYGIQVAKLAGVNDEVIKRAKEILSDLENKDINNVNTNKIAETKNKKNENQQLDFYDINTKRIINKIKNIDLMKLTPIDAINILYKLIEESKAL